MQSRVDPARAAADTGCMTGRFLKTMGLLGASICLAGLSACVSVPSDDKSGAAAKSPKSANRPEAPWYMSPFMKLIERHRKLGTHMDGPRCPMYPSCAAYAEKAVRRHSLLGFLLFVDRLFFRETGDLKTRYMIAPYRLSRHLRYYDPLEDTLPLFRARRPSLYREDFAN